jgi:Tol biopolymer transport system component
MLAFSSSSPEATVVYEQGRRRPLFGSSHVFAWSPDSRRLAVASGGNVSVGHADGSEAHVVCTPEGGAESLSWAPDNRTILYSTYDGELYTIRDDGTELQHIRSNAYLAAMSPDGTRVTYATGGGQQANPPMMMVLATGQETRLSEYPVSSIYEDPWRPWWPRFFWSPDSKYVMFGTYDGGDVYIVSRDGELALSIAGGGLPTWLPDGEHVAYLTIRGTTEFWIRVMDLSGSVTRTLVLPDEIKQTADYIFWSQR